MSSTGEIETLGWADYVVIGVMLAISAGIGVYYRFSGGRQKTTEEYFSADRSMSAAPLSLALMVSFMSAITLVGISAENYDYGTQVLALYFGYTLGTPASLYLYLPVFFKLQKTSAYEYLELRFGVVARLVASIANSMQLLFYTGVVLYAPALALEATTGLSGDISVLLIGIVCTFYSTIGGIKAVLVTDVFQGVLMLLAVVMVIIFAAINVDGGIAGIWQLAVDGGRIEFDNFSPDPTMRHTWWSLSIGGFCTFLTLYGVNQVQVQRLLTVRTLREAQWAMWGNWPLLTWLGISTSFSGLAMYAYYSDCDPVASGKISSTDMLMPYFVMQTMGHIPGLAGLFIAGIFSAGLSTVSAMLNSLAAVALEDYIKPTYLKLGSEFPEKHGTIVGKSLAVAIGVLCVLVAYLAKFLGSIVQASLTITGAIGGPLLGIFTLGMFFESADETGAVIGTLTSLAIVIWTAFGQPRPSKIPLPASTVGCNATVTTVLSHARQEVVGDSSDFYLYRISYMWYAPLGLVITVVVGLAVSNLLRLVTNKTRRELDPDLFTPPVANRFSNLFASGLEERSTLVEKILGVVIGVLSLLVAFLAKFLGSIMQVSLSITGAIGGPLLGIFTLGIFFESANEKGAVIGTLTSLAFVCWTAFGQPRRPSNVPLPVSTTGCDTTLATNSSGVRHVSRSDSSNFYLYRISYMWYAPLGFVLSVVVGLAVSNPLSFVTKETPPELDPDLFTPLIANRVRRRRLDASRTTDGQIPTSEGRKRPYIQ